MLDSLGSTLTRSTVSSFFTRHGKKAESDELSFEEAIKCLEDELGRPVEEKRRVDVDVGESFVPTPVLMVADGQGRELKLELMDFSKDQTGTGVAQESGDDTSDDPLSSSGGSGSVSVGVGGGALLPPEEKKKKKSRFRRGDKSSSSSSDQAKKKKSKAKPKKNNSRDNSELESEDSVERVINVKSCPLCHRPRMNSKAEMDIITHLAVCASRDWSSVDKIVVGNFVTASQAQRKWYTRVIGKISSGDYKLGAVCLFDSLDMLRRADRSWGGRIPQISLCRIALRGSWRRRRCRFMFGLGFGCCTRFVFFLGVTQADGSSNGIGCFKSYGGCSGYVTLPSGGV